MERELEGAGEKSNDSKERHFFHTVGNLFKSVHKGVRDFFLAQFLGSTKNESELFEEQFDPGKYIELYYPHIDVTNVAEISKILEACEVVQSDGNLTRIDAEVVHDKLRELHVAETQSTVSLENYSVYDFLARRALPAMLRLKPDDHFTILDIGGGPTVYQHIPLLGVSKTITHAEFLDSNRRAVSTWKNGGGYDWSSYVVCWQAFLSLHPEAYSMAVDEVRELLRSLSVTDSDNYTQAMRKKIEQVIPVDVFDDHMIPESKKFDVVSMSKWGSVELITSHFCIESSTSDPEKWKKGIENIGNQVEGNGFLLMTAIRNAEWYKVGDNKLPAVPVDYHMIAQELEKNGFEILEGSELITHNKEEVGYDGMVFMLARKI